MRAEDAEAILAELDRHDCRYVVVGSMARLLRGEDVEPGDLDVVVEDTPANRERVQAALVALDAVQIAPGFRRPVTPTSHLPWAWSWKVATPYGLVDVVVHFSDGTTATLGSDPKVAGRAHVRS